MVDVAPSLCNRAVLLAEGRIVHGWDARQLADASAGPGAFEARVMRALKTHAAAAGA